MEWLPLLYQILEACIIPLLGILTAYVIKFINSKSAQLQAKTDSDILDKYIAMLDDTICACVNATTQTYVDALKKDNAFTKEAQIEAFNLTYNAVMSVLTDEAKKYLASAYGDLNAYITNKIETEVKLNK